MYYRLFSIFRPVCDAEEIIKKDDIITETETNAEDVEQPKPIEDTNLKVADCIDSMVSEAVVEAALKDMVSQNIHFQGTTTMQYFLPRQG